MAALGRRLAEPIAVPAKQNGFFPKAFIWRGQRHDVRAVVSCRTEGGATGAGRWSGITSACARSGQSSS